MIILISRAIGDLAISWVFSVAVVGVAQYHYGRWMELLGSQQQRTLLLQRVNMHDHLSSTVRVMRTDSAAVVLLQLYS